MDNFIVTKYVASRRLNLILKGLKEYEKNVERERMKILDVGCGDGFFTREIRKRGYHIIGIDKHTPTTAKWMKHNPDIVMDAMDLKFKDNYFDIAIALEVVEHVPCFNEINRVLKHNGLFFCSTPSLDTDWIRKILVSLRILEPQDANHHDYLIDLKKVNMPLVYHKKMFLGTSQFGIFSKNEKDNKI